MRILPINNMTSAQSIQNYNADYNKEKNYKFRKNVDEKIPIGQIPLTAIKSKYCQSFGRFRKVDDVTLLNRDTGFNVKASLCKEKIGPYVSYKIFVDGKEAGYMDMDCYSLFPEGDYVLTLPNNVIPKITHLRSLLGKKYEGIGTALVNAAVKESRKRGNEGCLFLTAEKGYARTFSDYRSDENPIPFYYKLGFEAVNPQIDKLIKQCLSEAKYDLLPDSALLLLTPEAIAEKNKYFSKNYTFC